jgi:phage protein D
MIKVQGVDIDEGVTDLISVVSYESADGIADVLNCQVYNPDSEISDSKIFHIGNEIELWGGYGAPHEYIGAAVINKTRCQYPDSGQPMMSVTGYTRDHQMMDNAPPEAKKGKKKGKKGKGGRIFKDTKYSDAVKQRAGDYLFKTDIDPTPDKPHDFIQKAGMNDYEFVQGLANLTGFVFWVDRNRAGDWILHFKDPGLVVALQIKQYTFDYNQELATLLSFEPEMKFSGSYTKLVAHVKNAKTGKLLKVEVEDGKVGSDTEFAGRPKDKIIEPPPSGGGVKLFLGDFSVDVQTTKKFTTEAELKSWAAQWFERNRANFVIARGKTIGIEGLTARTIHKCTGVGTLWSGEYQFDRVKHIFDSGGGYMLDFSGRKVLPSP